MTERQIPAKTLARQKELFAEIQAAVERKRAEEEAIRNAIHAARKKGLTWESIGMALGMSKQAAWERYGSAMLIDQHPPKTRQPFT